MKIVIVVVKQAYVCFYILWCECVSNDILYVTINE